jgi:hypothetical protein
VFSYINFSPGVFGNAEVYRNIYILLFWNMCYKEVILMAKTDLGAKCCKWFPIVLVIVGLWFIAADLGYLSTYGLGLWPIVVTLVGLKMALYK